MGKRVLVTGGAGFIGSHVAERLLESGWQVEILDDLSKGKRDHVPAGVPLHVLDVRSSQAAQLVEEGAFDAVVHLAAQMDVRKSVQDAAADASINVLGTLNILEAVRRSPSAKRCRVIFSSTGGAVYGDQTELPARETSPKEPESPYAVAKLSVEYYMAYYARVHGIDGLALRYANVYGPRQDPHGEAGVIAIFCGRILDGKSLTVFGDGRQTRDYVFVGDVARATVIALTATLPPAAGLDSRSINIGTGVATSVLDLATMLLRVADTELPIEFVPPRAGEAMHSFLNVAKARERLHWAAEVTLEAGLARSFEWFAARRVHS